MISGMLLTVTRILFLFIRLLIFTQIFFTNISILLARSFSVCSVIKHFTGLKLSFFCRKHQQNHQSSLCRAAWVDFTWSWQVIFQLHALVPDALKSSSCLLLTGQKTQMVKSWSSKVQTDCRTTAKHAETKKRVKNRHDKIQKTVWKWKMW